MIGLPIPGQITSPGMDRGGLPVGVAGVEAVLGVEPCEAGGMLCCWIGERRVVVGITIGCADLGVRGGAVVWVGVWGAALFQS